MSKELDYIADLERENRTIKSLLYCTKRSCNNCGKVNCENFQRQRIDCCGLWVSYKDYIAELENKIADIKANCDLAIEGRDVKIKELELELTVEKDQHQEEIELHLHAEEYIKSLEQKLEQTEKDLADYQFNYPKIKELEQENAELKRDKKYKDQLAQAKEIIKDLLRLPYANDWEVYGNVTSYLDKAEQFLNEVEKC